MLTGFHFSRLINPGKTDFIFENQYAPLDQLDVFFSEAQR